MWQDNPGEKLTMFHVSAVSRQNNEAITPNSYLHPYPSPSNDTHTKKES